MLNIGRMGRGSQGYYLHNVARGAEDYYLGRGEAPGEWLGRGARGLGLAGQVTAEQLGRVLAAEHPATGEALSAHPARKVPGFDLTFRAPKSVSLLWGLADADVAAAVERAHDAAVAAAVGYLEEYAVRTRRGAGGAEVVQVDGLVGAAFRHRTSRAGDPLLHTHVLGANLVRASDDGRWRTLDSRRLFAHARTAGVLYQAHLRAELTRSLGVGWQPVTNGYADLDGVPREWIELFSKRRQAIVAELAARGEHSAAAAQVATLNTRQAKPHQPDPTTLRAGWRAEADRHGIPAGWWTRLLDRTRPERVDVEGLRRQLVDHEAVTATTSTFATPDLVRTIAERCSNGATVTDVVRSAGLILGSGLSSGEVVQLAHHTSGLTDITTPPVSDPWADGTRFTTRGLLLLEQAAINTSVARRNEGAAVADDAALQVALGQRPSLGDDQLAMVTHLTRDGDGVAVVVGKAGTGKTFALDAARDAWDQAGIRVTGTALAARAAIELQDSSGITSTTIARLLHQIDDHAGLSPLHPGQVLVIDEAGMVGTRTLARLLDHAARRQVKVVLVGDPHQLPEIDAGGLFVGLARRLPTIELTNNRRQTEDWEQATLDQLRAGSVGHAVDAYRHHGRLVAADTVEEIREQLVSDWWEAFDERTPGSAIMVALRRADVRDLNHRARARLKAAGLLTGPPHQAGDIEFQVGDRVMFGRNHRGYGLINGQAATLTRIRTDGWLEAERDDGRTAWISPAYVDAGHLTHGYAITGHKAQGLTVDHTFVLGSETLYREWGYVAMSRGRQTNRLYVHSQFEREPDAHIDPPTVDPTAATVTRLTRRRAEQPLTDDTAARWRELDAWLDHPDVQERPHVEASLRTTRKERARVAERLDALLHEQASWGVPALRAATRSARTRTLDTIATLQRQLQQLDRDRQGLADTLRDMPSPDQIQRAHTELKRLDRELTLRAVDRSVTALTTPPGYLVATIGPPPADQRGQVRWQQAAYAIERYRLDWDMTDPTRPYGKPPTDTRQRWARACAIEEVERAMRPPEHEVVRQRARGLSR